MVSALSNIWAGQRQHLGSTGGSIWLIWGMIYRTGVKHATLKEARWMRGPLQLHRAGAPLERVAMDVLVLLLCTHQGNKYILVVMDYFTK